VDATAADTSRQNLNLYHNYGINLAEKTHAGQSQSTAVWPAYRGPIHGGQALIRAESSCVYTLLSIIICIPEIIIHIIILRHPTWLGQQ
jgi:hypothetical protein